MLVCSLLSDEYNFLSEFLSILLCLIIVDTKDAKQKKESKPVMQTTGIPIAIETIGRNPKTPSNVLMLEPAKLVEKTPSCTMFNLLLPISVEGSNKFNFIS